MATHGTVPQFDPSEDGWTTYIERLNQYFIANEVDNAGKKRAILLSNCGPHTFKLIRSLVETGTLETTPFTDIVKLVRKYYEPKPS